MKKICIVFNIIILVYLSSAVFSQDQAAFSGNEPTWLLMERGKQAYNLGEYGLASRIFREILDREGIYPDAHIWLAYIFEQEGEYTLAEKQYLYALNEKSNLYILEDEITVLYRLAEIYRKTNQYGQYEKTLLSIISADNQSDMLNLQYSMLDSLIDYSFDKMFELYRYEDTKYSKARRELGIFYYRTGRYTEANINLILPVISAATTGFNFIYDKTADYDYYNLDLHIQNMLRYGTLRDFLDENNFFQSCYYLGASLYAAGYNEPAYEIWRIVYKYDADTWKIRAGRQLEAPFIEPIITHRS